MKINRTFRLWLFLVTVCLFMVACATTARLYNLKTGAVLNVSFQNSGTGHGTMTATLPDGQMLRGEYTTISDMSYSSGFGVANTRSSGTYAWATAEGFAFDQPGKQYGSAVLAGNGLVINIVYAVDPWTSHGYGVGKDNRGNKYKVMF